MEKRRVIPWVLLSSAICFWCASLWGRLELLELNRSLLAAENELSELQEEKRLLLTRLNEPIDLEKIEEQAGELGMTLPRREQMRSAESVLPDAVTAMGTDESLNGKIQGLIDRLRSCFAP